MEKQNFKQSLINQAKSLTWRIIITVILTLTAIITIYVYAAFIEPLAGPNDSDQDFLQNILGTNNADNDFTSTSVVSNADGSIIERQEYIQTGIGTSTDASSMSDTLFAGQQYIWDNRAKFGSLTKRVFVTSTAYTGNLGGLSGADAKCQTHADAASLGGTWKAILSTGAESAKSRIGYNWNMLVNMKGEPLSSATVTYGAAGAVMTTGVGPWKSYDGTNYLYQYSYPRYNESSVGQDVWVWSGTDGTTGMGSVNTCNNWTSSLNTYSGTRGWVNYIDVQWITREIATCDNSSNLYCIEQ